MKTITVYRVEHSVLRSGPWNTSVHRDYGKLLSDDQKASERAARWALNDFFYDNEEYRQSHPNVREDIKGWSADYVCAAPSLELLRDWFCDPECQGLLLDADFTVKEYVVESAAVLHSYSGRQVGFLDSGVVECRDLTLLALID